MKRLFLTLLCASLTATTALCAATDGEVAARRTALDIAGAFTNDGFKLRDGYWAGSFEPGKAKLLQVNLYAGNQYYFTLGATPAAKKVRVTVYDETGKPVATEDYQDTSVASVGFSPDNSGVFFVKVEVVDGAASDYCLVYSYK
ncbi:hypothetical protein CfE428DRAFT_0823 [Chthoniobacter flavus Ellin428]|uniref:Peptidase domain protein n=1 Tax=Chthoniobacter flavus Ellin428 TaxID=497964 RepID=B4CVY6_9BACT|nr:hypothetical protein [Chthoniobacter flavus]EDY21578.1 hypothetical protein CfE428DRAFT_0823 [Chthoniobacter flavus Ellin428]TCO95521.1 hypothetical protein EV701_101208 [Chthoniobacter flavus]